MKVPDERKQVMQTKREREGNFELVGARKRVFGEGKEAVFAQG